MYLLITGHGTLGELRAPLTAEFARHGLVAQVELADFDSYRRELTSPARTDLLLCVLDPYMLIDRLPRPWHVEDLEREVCAATQEWAGLVAGYDGTLVLNTVPLLPSLTKQLVDHRSRARVGIAWRQFNTFLLGLALDHRHVVTVDLEPLVSVGGRVHDPRLAGYAKAYLGPELLAGYAREVGHLARALRGRTKKLLVLDLDGTLWDGILAEGEIEAAGTIRGEAFRRFQQLVKQLAAQGVLLAISSKNDPAEVLATLAEHPDLVLRPDDFVVIDASWDPKPQALARIAEQTGFDPASIVFVDDNPTERGAVAAFLPEITVIPVDDEPALHGERLLADGWFDSLELTSDDAARASHYRREAQRKETRAAAISYEDYLRELAIWVDVSPVQSHEIARVAQLTQRTNQFNLTTERLRPAVVADQVNNPQFLVLAVRCADRFGSDGLVGAVFALHQADGLDVRNMVLSCRVLGRGIEQATMSVLLAHARTLSAKAVHGTYLRTARNGRCEDFYPSLGFTGTGDNTYRHDLVEIPAPPPHIRIS
jgi:FkbH-like protein